MEWKSLQPILALMEVGECIASSDCLGVTLWDVKGTIPRLTEHAHPHASMVGMYMHNGMLLSADANRTVSLWNPTTHTTTWYTDDTVLFLPSVDQNKMTSFCVLENTTGTFIASNHSDGGFYVHELDGLLGSTSMRVYMPYILAISAICALPDGSCVYSTQTGIHRVEPSTPPSKEWSVKNVKFLCAIDAHVFVSGNESCIQWWDVRTEGIEFTMPCVDMTRLSTCGSTIASGHLDGSIEVWEHRTMRAMTTSHQISEKRLSALCLTTSNRLASISTSTTRDGDVINLFNMWKLGGS